MATTPTVRGSVVEGAGASATTHTITFAQTTGDRVVIFFAVDATARTLTIGDSFVNLTNTSATFHIFTKVLDGSEGGNCVITAGVATKSAWLSYNITTGTHASATDPVFSTVATGTSTAPNSGSLSPSGGSAKYLWLSAFGMAGEEADDDTWCNSAPSTPGTFTGLVQKSCGTSGAVTLNCEVAAAQYASETATVDPGAFDTDQSLAWRAYTVAIYPAITTDAPAGLAAGTGTAYGPPIKYVLAGSATGTGAASWGSASYASTILADSPVAYWRLGEASGYPQDSAGTNHVTATTGSPTYGVTGALTGDANTSITLASSGQYFEVPHASAIDLGDGPWSIEFWFRSDTDTGAAKTIISKGTDSYLINVQQGTPDTMVLDKVGLSGYILAATGDATADGLWHHWVCVRYGTGAGNTLWYRDGVEGHSDSLPDTGFTTSSGTLLIGNEPSQSLGPAGGLDEIALYASTLSSTRVAAHYAAGTSGGGGTIGVKVAPNAGLASGTGEAYNPPFASATNAQAGLAAGTGEAYSPPIKYALVGLAGGTGAAHAPPASVAPNAGSASGTGAAYAPTLTCASNANAGHAAATGTAYGPPIKYVLAGSAAGTGAAYSASTKVAPAAGNATGTGAANAPVARVAPSAGAATGTGAASQPVSKPAPNAGHASATGAAYPTTMQYAPAGIAAGAGAAYGASESVAPNAGSAAGTGDAYQPTVTTGGSATSVYPDCASATGDAHSASTKVNVNVEGGASGTGAAYAASEKVVPNAGLAAGTGAAFGPPIKYVLAGLAAGTGAAATPATAVSPSAGAGAAMGAAGAPIPALGPSAGHAAGAGAAADTGKTVAPSAGCAAGTGAAYEPTISTVSGGTFADAGLASGTGAAYGPTTVGAPSVYAWCDAATATGAAYGVTLPTISGVTRDENGAAIPLCTVDAFVSATNAFYATTTSDAVGRYAFVVAPGVDYFLVAYDLVGDVYGVTARDLTA